MKCLPLNISSLKPLCLVLLLAVVTTSCGSKRHAASTDGGKYTPAKVETPKEAAPQTQALLTEANKWLGTKYKYGGNTKSGVDCSGLVVQIFLNALDIKLPRNSAQIEEYCKPIKQNQLIEGDLVFFVTGKGKKVNHVGMYIGDGQMIHASGSKGVMISTLGDPYYTRTYHSSGRVEQYYAMLSKNSKKTKTEATPTDSKKQKKQKKNKKDKKTPEPTPKPEETPSIPDLTNPELPVVNPIRVVHVEKNSER